MMRKVLVVEDEAIVAMLLEDMLGDLGYQVVAVEGRMDRAIARAHVTDADIAVLDVNLNGHLSYGVAEILRERSIPVIFATGYGLTGLDAAWRGCSVLEKPFEKTALQAAIEASMEPPGA